MSKSISNGRPTIFVIGEVESSEEALPESQEETPGEEDTPESDDDSAEDEYPLVSLLAMRSLP